MSIIITQAELKDTDEIMEFINSYWKKEHILAISKNFFLYEFKKEQKLNIIIAKDDLSNQILGFIGFFYYNSKDLPDLSGSIWKIRPDMESKLLGIKIRNHFVKTIKHRFFATPGPGIHMKPVYKVMRMDWFQMSQYYFANDSVKEYSLISNPKIKLISRVNSSNIDIKRAMDIKNLEGFEFNNDIVPLKDLNYIEKKYFNHPIYEYHIYYININCSIKNIFVCRQAHAENSSAYRIVDFFGELDYIQEIVAFLDNYIKSNDIEYVDFICHGYDNNTLINAGFNKVDFEDCHTIIPNYFEPFIKKNIPIYCVSNKTNKTYRQHKADGDMDRPSTLGMLNGK